MDERGNLVPCQQRPRAARSDPSESCRPVGYQARYKHDGTEHPAPETFRTRADTNAWLAEVQTDLRRGAWIDPRAGAVLSESTPRSGFSRARISGRRLGPSTGTCLTSTSFRPSAMSTWQPYSPPMSVVGGRDLRQGYRRPRRVRTGCSPPSAIPASPTRSSSVLLAGSRAVGARNHRNDPASIAEVSAAVESVPEHLRLAVLLRSWCQLRRGEIPGLQRRDVDELHGQLRIERAFVVHTDGSKAIGPPKTEAGLRTIAIPGNVGPCSLTT